MIFTNHRTWSLKVSEQLYLERQERLRKLIELKVAPPGLIMYTAQILTASFKWSWRGLLGDVWLWIQYSRPGWWAQWLLSTKFRHETDVTGLEMMDLLDEPEDQAPVVTQLYKLNPDAEAPSAEATGLGEYYENAFASIPQPYQAGGLPASPTIPPNQRRRFAEPWEAWRLRARGGQQDE